MRWGDMRPSENVEDRRGDSGGGGGRFPIGGGGMRLGGGAVIIIVIVSLLFGVNPMSLLGTLDGGGAGPAQTSAPPAPRAPPSAPASEKADPSLAFVQRTLGDTEDVWTALFKNMGSRYDTPRLVLFSRSYPSACGMANSAAGPFYCPADRKVYLDTDFFKELSQRFGAPGDFAAAYVIAHEIGHHVQNQLGILPRIEELQQQASRTDANRMQVMVELQADCFAGIWAHYADRSRGLLEKGDIEEGLNAAAAIGDDRLQKQAQGYVVPDAFTHGSSAQRVAWFRRGFEQGTPAACDTFGAERP